MLILNFQSFSFKSIFANLVDLLIKNASFFKFKEEDCSQKSSLLLLVLKKSSNNAF